MGIPLAVGAAAGVCVGLAVVAGTTVIVGIMVGLGVGVRWVGVSSPTTVVDAVGVTATSVRSILGISRSTVVGFGLLVHRPSTVCTW
jgi:hypothetical protein